MQNQNGSQSGKNTHFSTFGEMLGVAVRRLQEVALG
jgi:hypothetical protein